MRMAIFCGLCSANKLQTLYLELHNLRILIDTSSIKSHIPSRTSVTLSILHSSHSLENIDTPQLLLRKLSPLHISTSNTTTIIIILYNSNFPTI
ncbi:hypothetical protein GJ496_011333 [Pomphorhynchus laevis]|nr:hypothetical protein GJ496_011333 [Pomphorhynchus laevis]